MRESFQIPGDNIRTAAKKLFRVVFPDNLFSGGIEGQGASASMLQIFPDGICQVLQIEVFSFDGNMRRVIKIFPFAEMSGNESG